MNKSNRLVKLIHYLQSNRKMTVNQMAEELGVSRRTIFRDLRDLEESNVPLTYEKDFGHSLMQGYTLKPMMFPIKEVGALAIALNFLKAQPDPIMRNYAKEIELRINNSLPSEHKDYLNEIGKAVVVDPYLNNVVDKGHGVDWYKIADAIVERKEIEFDYEKANGEKDKRKVQPFLLVFYNDHWNLIGYDTDRKANRNFRISRIMSLEIDEASEFQENKRPIEDLIFSFAEKTYEIKLEIENKIFDQFVAHLPSKLKTSKELGEGKKEVSFIFDNLNYINEWLLQFGKRVKVIEPQGLIDNRIELLKEMLRS